MLSLKMLITKVGQVLIVYSIINIIEGNNYRCHYQHVFAHYFGKKVISCDFVKINYGKDESFNAVPPVEAKWNWTEVYDYDDFENSVVQVSFINSFINSVPNTIFETFKNIKAFNGSHMALKELNSLSFNKADYLQYIFLQNNHLTVIRDHVFVHCKYLKSLDLSKNRIKSISKNAFNSLEHLEQLNLSGNRLKKIEHDIFEPLVSMEYIWLNHNQLQEISSNYFTEQNQKLISIYLNNNKLTAVSPYAFEKLDNLKFLFLKGNKCVNADFKNYQISSNVGIKYEMKNCIKAFRKTHPEEEKRFDLTAMIKEIEERMELCKTSIDKFLEVDKTMLNAIQKFNNETEQ